MCFLFALKWSPQTFGKRDAGLMHIIRPPRHEKVPLQPKKLENKLYYFSMLLRFCAGRTILKVNKGLPIQGAHS
jgi:hypothetical protein